MAWICSKCNVEVAEVDDIAIKYGETELPEAEGLRCPNCGVEFLEAFFVTTELNSAEQMLEGK